MKKSELAAFIKEEIKSTLNTEGVWSRGNDIEIQQFIASVDQLKREFYDVVGSDDVFNGCLLYTSPSPRDRQKSRMPSSA